MTIRFSDALRAAIQLIQARQAELSGNIVLVRDLQGRIRLMLEQSEQSHPPSYWKTLETEFQATVGAYAPPPGQVILHREGMFSPAAVFETPDLRPVAPKISILDRTLIGADWLRAPIVDKHPIVPRATFFGMKGGVGRSTTLGLWARRLAQQGRKVLVVDLDLESPGVSSSLLPLDAQPAFGVVDWFVEDGVGQADAELLHSMANSSPMAAGTSGEIRVVPAAGTSGHLLDKLARTYAASFGERLAGMLDALEEQEEPDIVLIDSRAGLHDIAAITVTRLHAWSFLFAVNTPQTWQGYRHLFQAWHGRSRFVKSFRDHLQFVAALVPETGTDNYIDSTRRHAYELFLETLYDEAGKGDLDAFNFDLRDEEAPHYACPIRWRREFQTFSPDAPDTLNDAQIEAAYGEFFARAEQLVLGVNTP
ncbi:AAA family ATPase [Myxococcus sp. AM001]|nr:AAA family ATPase [Myxococcus sp. AM001]